jgi:hypothetical protein
VQLDHFSKLDDYRVTHRTVVSANTIGVVFVSSMVGLSVITLVGLLISVYVRNKVMQIDIQNFMDTRTVTETGTSVPEMSSINKKHNLKVRMNRLSMRRKSTAWTVQDFDLVQSKIESASSIGTCHFEQNLLKKVDERQTDRKTSFMATHTIVC